jgi:hypothetical protein
MKKVLILSPKFFFEENKKEIKITIECDDENILNTIAENLKKFYKGLIREVS